MMSYKLYLFFVTIQVVDIHIIFVIARSESDEEQSKWRLLHPFRARNDTKTNT